MNIIKQLNSIISRMDKVTECTCNGNGCKSCAIKVVLDGEQNLTDYETTETCKTDGNDFYRLITFINSNDPADNFQVWVDADGNVVPEVVGATDCTSECLTNIGFERCYDTGAGKVSATGYFTLSTGNIETYTNATVTASTDPAFNVGDNVLVEIVTWTLISCVQPETQQNLAVTTGTTGPIPAGFKAVTINSLTGVTTVAGGYELGDARRDISLSLGGERGNNIEELLPEISVSGGTFQWIALN